MRSSKRSEPGLLRVHVDIFRAVPVLTQLFIRYFGLVEIGIRLQPLQAAILGFGINGGAYLAEVFRADILSVHYGQTEAAQMLGMQKLAVLRIVVCRRRYAWCCRRLPTTRSGC